MAGCASRNRQLVNELYDSFSFDFQEPDSIDAFISFDDFLQEHVEY
jgi:hypothetical protein